MTWPDIIAVLGVLAILVVWTTPEDDNTLP